MVVAVNIQVQCCYKKVRISYEAVSSSKFDKDDVEIEVFSNF